MTSTTDRQTDRDANRQCIEEGRREIEKGKRGKEEGKEVDKGEGKKGKRREKCKK